MQLHTSVRLMLAMLMFAVSSLTVQAAELKDIGRFDFPTSASPQAQEHFLQGVGYLHSFGWVQAREAFQRAREADPDFALAYWGEAFTYNHPLISEWDPEAPKEVLNRLGETPEERLAKAATEREKGFVRAAQAYAFTSGPVSEKRRAWMEAMEELYQQFPEDDEVKAFYAVSMISGSTAFEGVEAERLKMRAGSLALELFRKNPRHPGAAHYIIHAFDDPIHAPIALDAARQYAEITPAVAHARHMPTHIFIQHGMWPEVSEWNESAFRAAQELWRPGDRPNDLNHAGDWGQYGDLQMMNLERSREWIAKAEQVLENNPEDARSIRTLRAMRARHIIESRQWELRELTDRLNDDQLLALGLSAVHLGRLDLAQRVADRLGELAEANPGDTAMRVSHAEVAAMVKLRQSAAENHLGNRGAAGALQQEALDRLDDAVELTEQRALPRGAPNPLKPVHELTGEALLEAGRPEAAREMFEESLWRRPNRPWSQIGLARVHRQLNDPEKAARYYRAALETWREGGSDFPARTEAREYLAGH